MKVGSSLEQNESLLQTRESHCPRRSESWAEAVDTYRLRRWNGLHVECVAFSLPTQAFSLRLSINLRDGKELDALGNWSNNGILKSHKRAIAWKLSDIKGVSPEFCTHKILMEEDYEPSVQTLGEPVQHCVPKKGGMTVITNEENELIPTRLVTGWREMNTTVSSMVSRDTFRSQLTQKIRHAPYHSHAHGTFAYLRILFGGLCNAPGTFQRCMMAIFHDMIEKTMEVFMDDFSVFGDSFSTCLTHLEKMLKRCEDTNLSLNWESHFMVKEGIVLGHKISKSGLEVDRAKVEVITKLPHPTSVKGVRSFLGHAGFYRRFIQTSPKFAPPMNSFARKRDSFVFSEECCRFL
ncbi:reverse transcriptase domain-containing protein [Tanacetum coccineum]